MGLAAIVFSNQLYYARKIVPVILICGLILLIPAASILLVNHIRALADQPLAALNTELILQHDQGNKEAAEVRTKGLVEPFNRHSFAKESTMRQLAAIPGIHEYSSALVLWQFDPKNTLSVVGLDPSDPMIGFRKVEGLLTKGSRFFSSSNAEEVLLERHFSTLFGYKPGSFFTLADRNLKIIGLVDFKEQSNLSSAAVFLPYETALSLAGQSKKIINQVFIALASTADIDQVSRAVERSFPGFSLISKDSLYKNLSAFNRLIYRSGHFVVLAVFPLALLLLAWTLKINRLEFAGQIEVLKILGWPKSDLRRWLAWDTCYLLLGAATVAAILTASLYWGLLPQLQIAPLLDQGFHL
jgi:predicted lysophospholipase L1 biosynthesis ABC-type transport system permease subunit